MRKGSWIESFRIRSYEADATGVVTPASICNFLQEAAGNHAFALDVSVEQLHARGLTWMLSRLRLRLDRLPRWRESIEMETWPSGTSGVLAVRDFLLRTNGQELGRATTGWLLIDLARRRPARLTEEILRLRVPDREPALPVPDERLPEVSEATHVSEVPVRWSDMDVNEHTNNVRYVAWALDALSDDVLRGKTLSALSVDFTGETRAGDVLEIRTAGADEADEAEFRFEIRRKNDQGVVARVLTRWRAGAPA